MIMFPPPRNRNANLKKYIQTVEDFPLDPQKKTKPNLSKMETEAIKTLANDTSIVIKEADKGGATIIMDQSHYKDTVENTLNDKNVYETLDSDPSKAIYEIPHETQKLFNKKGTRVFGKI